MALKAGYSRATVSVNIGALMREGKTKPHATMIAFSAARAVYFKRHPHGFLPGWLAFPRGKRNRADYDAAGHPRQALTPQAYRDRRDPPYAPNPAPRAAQIQQAARRIARFTGMKDVTARKLRISRQSDVVIDIGRVDGILYTTIRDEVTQKYIHRFARNARPLLAAAPDGKRLYLLGGAYTFTDRGIVDRKRSRPRSR